MSRQSKLTDEQVVSIIKAKPADLYDVAEECGISYSYALALHYGRSRLTMRVRDKHGLADKPNVYKPRFASAPRLKSVEVIRRIMDGEA